MWDRSKFRRALLPERFGDLIPEGLYSWCYVVLVPLIIAVRYILQRAGILKDRTLLSTQLFVAVVIDLMVEGLYHVGCWWTDVSALSGPLICLN